MLVKWWRGGERGGDAGRLRLFRHDVLWAVNLTSFNAKNVVTVVDLCARAKTPLDVRYAELLK